MTTVALLRTTYLNDFLKRVDGATLPWSDNDCNHRLTEACTALWHDGVGKRAQGTVATSQASDVYTIPALLQPGRISRIELERVSGGVTSRIDKATAWTYYSDTQVRISPLLPTDATLTLRFFGWVPYLTDATDLPTRLESAVAMKAAALAFGQQTGFLVNSQLQQGLDQGRVVDMQTDVSLSAYWERRYQDIIHHDQNFMSYAPRRSAR